MRILELCLSPDFGGLEMNMKDFCGWLARQEACELHLAVQTGCRIHRALRVLGVPTIGFPTRSGKLPFLRARKLAAYIQRHKIDVVHLHWKDDLPLVALAKRICRRRFAVVHTRHMNLPGKKLDPYHRFLYGSLDAFIAVTDYLADQARRHLPMDADRIHRGHYGFTPPEEVAPERVTAVRRELGIHGEFCVGLLGRISHYKGQHLLIEAVDQLRQIDKRVDAWIVGEPFDAEYLDQLQETVRKRQLEHQVHFLGFQKKPYELFPCFDAVTLTTRNETFGLVLIEAMHAGVAVVGSDEGGVPEIIDHERTGLVFESWNACALANALERLYDDSDLRTRLAVNGRVKAMDAFDQERQNRQVWHIIQGVLPARRTLRHAG